VSASSATEPLHGSAHCAGPRPQRFLVESALPGGRPSLLARRALYREFFAARRDLHGACTNLNQLAHLGNQRDVLPQPMWARARDVVAASVPLGSYLGSLRRSAAAHSRLLRFAWAFLDFRLTR
jgi:hypothetical protein